VAAFVAALRARSVSPHIAIDGYMRVTGKPREASVDGRVTRHSGYAISQRCRKRIEEVFGWRGRLDWPRSSCGGDKWQSWCQATIWP
jgi:hypothetical protein